MSLQIFSSENCGQIPERAGVYAFFYNPYQPNRLGLYGEFPGAERVLEARRALRKKLDIFSKLLAQMSLVTHANLYSPGGRGLGRFAGALERVDLTLQDLNVDSMGDSEFVEFVRMAEQAAPFLQPIYCGMTIGQGLATRYGQHFADYRSGRSGTFGGRMAASGLDWDDLAFQCIPVRPAAEAAASVANLERHLLMYANPILSIK